MEIGVQSQPSPPQPADPPKHKSSVSFSIPMASPPEIVPQNTCVTYPFSMVWRPITMLTWLVPFLGHLGISTSSGAIHDYASSFMVTVDRFSSGPPHKSGG